MGEALPYLVMFLHPHLFPGAQVLSPCKMEYTTPQHTDNNPALLSWLAGSFRELYVNNLVPSSWHFGKIVKLYDLEPCGTTLHSEEMGTWSFPPSRSHST